MRRSGRVGTVPATLAVAALVAPAAAFAGSGRATEAELESHRYRGTYNITDFRFFGLRDNNSSGPGFQQYFGLLRDDYTEKPAFDVYRRAVARCGARDG